MTNEGTSVRSTECMEFMELKIPGRKIVYIYFPQATNKFDEKKDRTTDPGPCGLSTAP